MSCAASRQRPPPPTLRPHPQPQPSRGTWDVVPGDWIVRFTAYKPAADHVAALTAALGAPSAAAGWAWLPRANPATALPTDFGVLWATDAVRVR